MRKQFVLDKRRSKLLEELASYRGGNRNLVIRKPARTYAGMEDHLDKMEANPPFQERMAKSDADRTEKSKKK